MYGIVIIFVAILVIIIGVAMSVDSSDKSV